LDPLGLAGKTLVLPDLNVFRPTEVNFEVMMRNLKQLAMVLGLGVALVALQPTLSWASQEEEPSLSSKKTPKSNVKTEIVQGNQQPMLSPDAGARMQAIADRYESIIADGGFPKVRSGSYKKGSKSEGVIALNKRLFLDGYLRAEGAEGEFASVVTSATIDALTRFQRNMGLPETGKMDQATLRELNVPATQRLATIQANISRLEAYGQNLGDRYLVVNVPGQVIEAVNGGRVYSRHRAIVGRPERPTPVVMAALSDVNFNPYWNAPPSIIERDIIPKLRSGTQVLQDMDIKVFQGFGGPEIDPSTVDWKTAIADDYHFRQEPGPANAMATAKINFPSPFGIYLHDTPEKQLFNNSSRFYSSGCVRVDRMDLLLDWVLNGQDGIGESDIAVLAETLERKDVKLTTPPQLRVAYLTAWPVGKTVAFRGDVYGLDGTGFTVGQPLPVGETSEEGQRFVLKPVPRKAGAVDAAEAEGLGLFGRRLVKSKKVADVNDNFDAEAPKSKSNIKVVSAENDDTVIAQPKSKKLPFEVKKTEKKTDVKAAGKDKKFPGLFDWAAYRKEQAGGSKVVKKKIADPKKKPDAKITKVDPKKPAVTEKKVIEKVAVADPKKPLKPKVEPKIDDKKKVADLCKADAKGALPKGCKAPVKKPDVKKPAVKTP
jgi:murein L,D-transpeptidase YcbB/YkuD